jgi:hypothetical protein
MPPNRFTTTAKAALTLLALAGLCAPAAAQFRTLPYLQNPASDSMTLTLFSQDPNPGEVRVQPLNRRQAVVLSSQPVAQPALAYTTAERNQTISGLPQGSWLLPSGVEGAYKHTVQLSGLRANMQHRYVVTQGGQTFEGSFRTAPTPQTWQSVRFLAVSDSETEPAGRVARREWAPGALSVAGLPRPATTGSAWAQRFGVRTLSGVPVLNYALTEDEGLRRNLEIMRSRQPDFVLMPGDLVQGGGYQPGWDEFFRQTAGELGQLFSHVPLLPALGNWENFGALNGGYGNDAEGVFGPKRARDKYHVYFDAPDNGTPTHRDNYYRIDYGPVTVLTLDSSNGEPDDRPQNYPVKATGQQFNGPGTDTQNNFTRAQYEAAGGLDLADFNPGSTQWNWALAQLADARSRGQIIFVQFHHAPYSSGEHGQPMDHELSTGQGGTPMRRFHPLFEQFGVVAVLSGHSEMFERSFVDEDRNGVGVHYYDVGVAGDGLRGSKRNGSLLTDPLLNYNPFSVWTADQGEPEHWELVDGTPQLTRGGKHYGHLEVNVTRLPTGSPARASVSFSPVHSFPVLDAQYNLVRTERRVYGDEWTVLIGSDGRPLAVTPPGAGARQR